MIETPEQIAENMRLMTEEIKRDSFTYDNWLAIINAMHDRWLDIIEAIQSLQNGSRSFQTIVPPVQRQLSVLALEMDRVSTRNVLEPEK